jgi:hypothetical protein
MANIVNGTPVNFTFGSVAIVITNITGALYQGLDFKKNSNRTLVKDQSGNRVTSAHNDQFQSLTIKWVVTAASMATALVNTALQEMGSYIVITACATIPELVSANKWEVIGASLPATNDSVKEITLEVEFAAGIQTFPATA